MIIKKLILGPFSVNCYIVKAKGLSFMIDPGSDFITVDRFLKSEKIIPEFILNTHGHYDHIGAVPDILGSYNIPFYIHRKEEEIIIDPGKNMSSFFGGNTLSLKTYKLIDESDIKFFNNKGIDIINTPGHTPGSISIRVQDCLFTGDLLFKGAVGRTDLPGGNVKDIINSLKKLLNFKRDLSVYPGHGESSTLEAEFNNNYYLSKDFLESGDNWL